MTEFLTDERVKVLRRLLYVVIGFGVLVALLALPLITGDYVQYGSLVIAIGVALGVLAWLTLRAIRDRAATARRMCVVTGVATVVLSLPLVPIWIGLLTVITGIGLLVITFAPEREPR